MPVDRTKLPSDAETGGMADIVAGRRIRALRDGLVDADRRIPANGRVALNGGVAVYTIAHGLGAAPASAVVVAGSAAAAAAFFVTFDATNITVTFSAAPAAGTANVVLNWMAALA